MKKILFGLLLSAIFLTACTAPNSQSVDKLIDNNKDNTQNSNSISNEDGIKENSEDISEKDDDIQNPANTSKEEAQPNDNIKEENISEKIKAYIISGQESKPEAQKIKWSKSFLDKVDIENLYKQYISSGGSVGNLEDLAKYITLNAPIPSEWEKLFEKDLYDAYGEKVIRLEHLEGDLYQAYIQKDGIEVPYVVVSSRTGYFHG